MSIYYLLVGHILGDFTFQTNTIAIKKQNNWKWLLIHVIIVTICLLVFSISYGYIVILLILLNGVIHFLIDYYKSKLSLKSPSAQLAYFIMDQILHIGILYWIFGFARVNDQQIFTQTIIKFVLAFLFILSFSSILIQYLLKLIFNQHNESFFLENEKSIGNYIRVSIFILLYFSYIFKISYVWGIPLFVGGIIFYYNKEWKKWMNYKYFTTRLIFDFMTTLCGFLISIR